MKYQCTRCDQVKPGYGDFVKFSCTSLDGHEPIKILEKKEIDEVNQGITKQDKKTEIKKVKGKLGTYYVESIVVDNKPFFLCNIEDKLELRESIDFDDKIFKPLEKDECGYFPYEFTKQELENLMKKDISKENLLNELKEKIDYYIDIRERDKHLILGDLLLSYCQEWIDTLHFLYCVGETESGKSTVLHLFRWLGYRNLYGEDIPNADIYNFLGTDEEATGTISEDEAQDITTNREKIRTYKNSYSRGSKKARIMNVDSQNKRQVFYKTFCFKLFAGELVPQDKGFKERLAILHMSEGLPKGNIKRLGEDEKKVLQLLRNGLLVWKVQNINKGLDKIDSGLEKRDQELWEDYLRVISGTKYYNEALTVVDFYTKQRHEGIWNSLEARIFKIVIKRLNENLGINLENFWLYIADKEQGDPELDGELLKQTFWPNDFPIKVTRNSLSRLFNEKFQAIRKQTHEVQADGKQHERTFYEFDSEICQKLAKKYNIAIPIDSHALSCGQGGQGG